MLSGTPDKTLGLERLEREIHGFCQEAAASASWQFRESYIDRGVLDPFYILQFRKETLESGDDLYDQELFATPFAHLKGVCMTREAKGPGGAYWRAISKDHLIGRLRNFMQMYREDYLQPPGYRGIVYAPTQQHERLKEKRFLFELRSMRRGIIGVGPKMYAGAADIGAVCGQVTDENGEPLAGAIVELITNGLKVARTTDASGLFWFSKVPKGKYRIQVAGRGCLVQILRQDEFGNIKGWLSDQDGNPVENAALRFVAPDGEVFGGFSDPSGKFTTGPLPAYPVLGTPLSGAGYRLSIPDFMFSIQKSITVSDAIIGGTLRDVNGAGMTGKTVTLKQADQVVATCVTDTLGNFLFCGLKGGRYQIEVDGQKIHAREIYGGTVSGKVADGLRSVKLELTAKGTVVAAERTSLGGEFTFENVAPGRYKLNIE